jgi:hypothetical protein
VQVPVAIPKTLTNSIKVNEDKNTDEIMATGWVNDENSREKIRLSYKSKKSPMVNIFIVLYVISL